MFVEKVEGNALLNAMGVTGVVIGHSPQDRFYPVVSLDYLRVAAEEAGFNPADTAWFVSRARQMGVAPKFTELMEKARKSTVGGEKTCPNQFSLRVDREGIILTIDGRDSNPFNGLAEAFSVIAELVNTGHMDKELALILFHEMVRIGVPPLETKLTPNALMRAIMRITAKLPRARRRGTQSANAD